MITVLAIFAAIGLFATGALAGGLAALIFAYRGWRADQTRMSGLEAEIDELDFDLREVVTENQALRAVIGGEVTIHRIQ